VGFQKPQLFEGAINARIIFTETEKQRAPGDVSVAGHLVDFLCVWRKVLVGIKIWAMSIWMIALNITWF